MEKVSAPSATPVRANLAEMLLCLKDSTTSVFYGTNPNANVNSNTNTNNENAARDLTSQMVSYIFYCSFSRSLYCLYILFIS